MFLNKTKAADERDDFRLRTPFSTYRPVDYKPYQPFIPEKFKPVIDGYLDKLFAKEDAVDAGSKDSLDPLLYDMAAKAEEHLNSQKAGHIEAIHNFYKRHCSDKTAIERQLERIKTALAEVNEELENITNRCSVNKF